MYAKDMDVFRRACYENRPITLKGKTYRYKIVCGGQAGQYRNYLRRKRPIGKRNRATALVIRDGRVLLVKDKNSRRYSLPGGPIRDMESGLDAVKRHLQRETGLKVRDAYVMFNHDSRVNLHRVYRIDAIGKARVSSEELSKFAWWDGNADTPVRKSVREIVSGAKVVFGQE